MKYAFIINPISGSVNKKALISQIEQEPVPLRVYQH